jgi:hypothetical protein
MTKNHKKRGKKEKTKKNKQTEKSSRSQLLKKRRLNPESNKNQQALKHINQQCSYKTHVARISLLNYSHDFFQNQPPWPSSKTQQVTPKREPRLAKKQTNAGERWSP